MPGYRIPLYYRPGSSDADVIRQVFVQREYECIGQLRGVRTIIDCGANIGCTAFYLLHRYPNARLIAIEPDSANMEVCRKNLAPFKDKVTFLQAGIWSRSAPLKVLRGDYRDGREWSFQVTACAPNESPDVSGITIEKAIAALGGDWVDILKIDIEAAEGEVFSGSVNWLARVGAVAIEIHGNDCANVVHKAFDATGQWQISRRGELTRFLNMATRTLCAE
jgi:FkbM family methyltransferase